MHCTMNESTLIEKISQVLANGLLSTMKEVEVGYSEDSKDDVSSIEDTSPRPYLHVSTIRF